MTKFSNQQMLIDSDLDLSSHKLINVSAGSAGTDVYNITQVDSAIAAAVVTANPANGKAEVKYATTGALPTYSGSGATALTLTGQATFSPDTTAVINGDRVLVKDETGVPSDNGVYIVSGVGSTVVLTRSTDTNTATKISQMFTFVSDGTQNQGNGYVEIDIVTTINSDAIQYVIFNKNNNLNYLVKTQNLADLGNTTTARTNLDVYSTGQVNSLIASAGLLKVDLIGYIGSGTVSSINGLTPNQGDVAITTDANTITLGTLTVAGGDVVEFNGEIWTLRIANSGGFVPSGVKLINDRVPTLTLTGGRGQISTFAGSDNIGVQTTGTLGEKAQITNEGSINEDKIYESSGLSGVVSDNLWGELSGYKPIDLDLRLGAVLGVGYVGNFIISDINALSPVAGEIVIALSAGTPTAGGSSDALVIGDTAEFDGTNWKKILTNSGGFVPVGNKLVTIKNTDSVIADGNIGEIAIFDGLSNTPTYQVTVDGNEVFNGFSPSINYQKEYILEGTPGVTGGISNGTWDLYNGGIGVLRNEPVDLFGLILIDTVTNINITYGISVTAGLTVVSLDSGTLTFGSVSAVAGDVFESNGSAFVKIFSGVNGFVLKGTRLLGNLDLQLGALNQNGIAEFNGESNVPQVIKAVIGDSVIIRNASSVNYLNSFELIGGGNPNIGNWIKTTPTAGNGLTNVGSNIFQVTAANTSIDVSSNGVKAAIPSINNKGITSNTTSGNYQLACSPSIGASPLGYVGVKVNGVSYQVGNGDRTHDCYFSSDGGTTAVSFNLFGGGEQLYWNGVIAGFDLINTWKIDFEYNVV